MDGIAEQAQRMFSRCVTEGFCVESVPDRHHAEALRAEVRRLARRFSTRVATTNDEAQGRVVVARKDEMPWDGDQQAVAERMSREILGSADDQAGDQGRP